MKITSLAYSVLLVGALSCTNPAESGEVKTPTPSTEALLTLKSGKDVVVQSSGVAQMVRYPHGFEFAYNSGLNGTVLKIPFSEATVSHLRLTSNYSYAVGVAGPKGSFTSAEGGASAGSGRILEASLGIGVDHDGFRLTGFTTDETVEPVGSLKLDARGSVRMSCRTAQDELIDREQWSSFAHCSALISFFN